MPDDSGAEGGDAAAAGATARPHPAQNFAPAGNAAPQPAHTCGSAAGSAAPQLVQNFAPAVFGVLQAGQVTTAAAPLLKGAAW
jgi:hypothetical protein